MRLPSLCLLPVLLAGCAADEPNRTRTGAYATEQLVVRVFTTVRAPREGHTSITISKGNDSPELFVGEGDEVFLVQGGRRQDAGAYARFSFIPSSDRDELQDLQASFVRDGRASSIPVWQGPLPTVVVPREIVMGSTVDIDISPRPAPGTPVWIALHTCFGTLTTKTIPWKLDTTTIPKTEAAEKCCEGVAPNRRCTVSLESEYDTRVPIVDSPFDPASEVRTRYHLQSQSSLRL